MRTFVYQQPQVIARTYYQLPYESYELLPPDYSSSDEWTSSLNQTEIDTYSLRSKNGFTIPRPASLFHLSNCLVHHKSLGTVRALVEISPNVIVADLSRDSKWLSPKIREQVPINIGESSTNLLVTDAATTFDVEINGESLLFDHLWMDNYFHTIYETGTRFYIYEQFFKGKKGVKAIYHPTHSYQVEFFNLLNKDYEFELCSTEYKTASFQSLWAATLVDLDFVSKPYLHWLRAKLSPQKAANSGVRLFNVRKQVNQRTIVNFDEVWELLKAHSFIAVDFADLSVRQQIDLLAATDVICGPSGANFANIVFGHNLKVIEMLPISSPHPGIWILSKWLGHSYGRIMCDDSVHQAMTVNITELKQVLNKFL